MDYKPRIDCKAFEEEKDTGIIRELEGNIELKNVNFNYPSKIDVPKEYYSKEYFFSNILKRNLILIMKIYVVFFIVFFF